MNDSPLDLVSAVGEALLELLHREAEGELSADEQRQLDECKADPDVQAARTALRRAVMFLSGPNPPLPRSVASSVATEVALSRALAAPTLPRTLAAEVSGEIALAHSLAQTPPLPATVAARVTADIALARQLAPPSPPQSVAAAVLADIAGGRQLEGLAPVPAPRWSVAASLAARIAREGGAAPLPGPPIPARGLSPSPAALSLRSGPGLASLTAPPVSAARPRRHNPAPLLLLGGLLAGVTLLALTTAWPNLAAGAVVLHTLLEQVSPLAGVGLALLLLTSALMTWKPVPELRAAGAGAFALAAVLTLPALYNVAGGQRGLSIGRNVTVSGPVSGNVIAIGGNIDLQPGARVRGEVVTLLGDVHRSAGARVGGQVSTLLGQARGDEKAVETRPVSALSLATAAAFRPVLGWLGGAAWPQIFVALTGGLLLLLYVSGAAPALAQRQRHAPVRTLSLGVLLLAALILPALGLALVGWLGPALLGSALTALMIATGLSVSVYDAGRALAFRLRLPAPDIAGALLGLSAFAASLSYAPLAFALALVGGAWGAGTLLLTRPLPASR